MATVAGRVQYLLFVTLVLLIVSVPISFQPRQSGTSSVTAPEPTEASPQPLQQRQHRAGLLDNILSWMEENIQHPWIAPLNTPPLLVLPVSASTAYYVCVYQTPMITISPYSLTTVNGIQVQDSCWGTLTGPSETIAAISPYNCGSGCTWVFDHWSDGGAQSHTITGSTSYPGPSFTAYYRVGSGTPTTNQLNGIYMTDSSNGWAVGAGGTIMRGTNGAWTPFSSPANCDLYAVNFGSNGGGSGWNPRAPLTPISSSDGWAVGGGGSCSGPTAIHWNGAAWSVVANGLSSGSYYLKTVWMNSGYDIWAGGSDGHFYHFSGVPGYGGGWNQYGTASCSVNSIEFDNSYEGWAVDGCGYVYHYSGGGWVSFGSLIVSTSMNGIFLVPSGTTDWGWAVGNSGTIYGLYQGGYWTGPYSPGVTSVNLNGISCVSNTNCWVAGSYGSWQMVHWTGSSWTAYSYQLPDRCNERGIFGTGTSSYWAVGDMGTILFYDGTYWQIQTYGGQDYTCSPQVSITVTSSPATGSGYVTVDGSAITTPQTYTWTQGSSQTLAASSPVSCGSGCQYEYNNWSDGLGQSHSITVPSSATTYTATFKKEWSISFSYAVSGTPPGSPTAPSLSYKRNGVTQSPVALTGTSTPYWVDDGTTWTVSPNPLSPSTSTEQWSTNQATSATASASTTISLTYFHQYKPQLSYGVVGGGSPTAPTLTANSYGSSALPQTLTTTPTISATWYDAGATWTATNPLGGSFERWYAATPSGTIGASAIAVSYQHQYQLTMNAGTSGTVTPSSGWQNAGASVTITATPNSGYAFTSWTGSGTGSYSGSNNPATNGVTMSAAITETANFVPIYSLTVSAGSGGSVGGTPSGSYAAGYSVSITATASGGYQFSSWSISGASCSGGSSSSPCAFSMPSNAVTVTANFVALVSITITSTPSTGSGYVTVDGVGQTTPYVISWAAGSSHTIAAISPVSCGSGCQYEWNNWSDGGAQSHLITVPSTATTYTATFKKEWSITFSYSVSGGGTPTSPTLGYTKNGVSQPSVSLTRTGTPYWVDDGTTWLVTPNPLAGSTSTERWYTSQLTSGPVNSSTTVTLTYYHQYQLTMQCSPTSGCSSLTPAVGTSWQNAGSSVTPGETPAVGYVFTSWTCTGSGCYSGTSTTGPISAMNAAITETANFVATVSDTITSSPSGSGLVIVDGTPQATPYIVTWNVGDSHTIAAVSPVSCGTGCQYVWQSWSDNGVQSHTITVPSFAATYTATFQQQFYLTMQAGTGGTATPTSSWQNAGIQIQIDATPAPNYMFSSWAGNGTGSYSGASNPATITMNGPISEVASFQLATVEITITSSPTTGAGFVTVNGSPISTPQTFSWIIGSSHNITANSPVSCGSGCQYVWQSWSDGGAKSHSYLAPNTPDILQASFKTQFSLTMSVSPVNGGSTSPVVGIYWYDANSTMLISATPASGFEFISWSATGSGYSGSLTSRTITMTGPITETANFQKIASVNMIVSYQVDRGGSGYSPPAFTFVNGGINETYTLTTAPASIALDQGSSWSVAPNPLKGSTNSERWHATQSLSGTANSNATIIFAFQHQYSVSVSFAVTGGGSAYSAPSFTGTSSAALISATLSETPYAYWLDTGSAWSAAPNPLSGSTSIERWSSDQALNGTISSVAPIVVTYQHQYVLNMLTDLSGAATTTPAAGSTWQNAGAAITIQATPTTGAFSTWTGSGSGSYTGIDNPASITVNGAINETAIIADMTEMTITTSIDPSSTVKVDGTLVSTSYSTTWLVGEQHTVSALSPIGCGSGCQYVWTSWSDRGAQTHQVTAQGSNMTLTVNYVKEYSLSISQSTSGATNPGSGTYWYVVGEVASVSASPGPGYLFTGWLLDGQNAGSSSPLLVTMSASHNVVPQFLSLATPLCVYVNTDPAGLIPVPTMTPSSCPMAPGTEVTVTAQAISSWDFVEFTATNTTFARNGITITFTMPPASVSAIAHYKYSGPNAPGIVVPAANMPLVTLLSVIALLVLALKTRGLKSGLKQRRT